MFKYIIVLGDGIYMVIYINLPICGGLLHLQAQHQSGAVLPRALRTLVGGLVLNKGKPAVKSRMEN
jgi:hypothetical protein